MENYVAHVWQILRDYDDYLIEVNANIYSRCKINHIDTNDWIISNEN